MKKRLKIRIISEEQFDEINSLREVTDLESVKPASIEPEKMIPTDTSPFSADSAHNADEVPMIKELEKHIEYKIG